MPNSLARRRSGNGSPRRFRISRPSLRWISSSLTSSVLEHRVERHGEALLADADQQRLDDRERDRQRERHGRPGARRRVEVDQASERRQVRAHDVHADAAATRLADLVARREAGLEHERERLLGREHRFRADPARSPRPCCERPPGRCRARRRRPRRPRGCRAARLRCGSFPRRAYPPSPARRRTRSRGRTRCGRGAPAGRSAPRRSACRARCRRP